MNEKKKKREDHAAPVMHEDIACTLESIIPSQEYKPSIMLLDQALYGVYEPPYSCEKTNTNKFQL